jgi:nucleotide-binding universal stress UspA family protein
MIKSISSQLLKLVE